MNGNSETYTLITGASGGIGREMAEVFAKKGNNLVLIARRKDVLEEITDNLAAQYNIKVLTTPCDLSKVETPKYIYEWCKEKHITVDTVVNNAGAGLFGEFKKLDIEKQMDLISLNINALVKLNYYFIPDLLKLPKGSIINVSSIAALYPLPYYSVYGATKAFVLSFTEALSYELQHTNITVRCLCPGDTDTDFFIKAGNINKKSNMGSPSLVAEAAVQSLQERKTVVFTLSAKSISKIPRFILKKLVAKRVSNYKR